jgi:large subunit ribosomal protein L25
MIAAIQPELRRTTAKSELRKLRAAGKIPGVVYGPQIGSIPISIDEKVLHPILARHARSILQMEIPGKGRHAVLLSGVQRDMIVNKPMHVDFQQVSLNEEIRVRVPVEFVGTAAGVKEGGVRTVINDSVEVRRLPERLPSVISVDISSLQIGENLTAGSLELPEGVALLTDASEVLIGIAGSRKSDESDEEAEAAS